MWCTLCQNPRSFWTCTGRICDPSTTQTVNPAWSEPSAAMWWKQRAGRNFAACFAQQRDTHGLTEIWKDSQMQLLLQWASWSTGRAAGAPMVAFTLRSYTDSQGLSLISRQIVIIFRTVASAGEGRSPFVTWFLYSGVQRLHWYTHRGSDTACGAWPAVSHLCCDDVAAHMQ